VWRTLTSLTTNKSTLPTNQPQTQPPVSSCNKQGTTAQWSCCRGCMLACSTMTNMKGLKYSRHKPALPTASQPGRQHSRAMLTAATRRVLCTVAATTHPTLSRQAKGVSPNAPKTETQIDLPHEVTPIELFQQPSLPIKAVPTTRAVCTHAHHTSRCSSGTLVHLNAQALAFWECSHQHVSSHRLVNNSRMGWCKPGNSS
jgi:hypothetical protein